MKLSPLAQIAEVCSSLLYEYQEAAAALDYLNKRLSPATQKLFGFGFFPPQHQLSILFSSLDSELLVEHGLAYSSVSDSGSTIWFSAFQQHNLVLPYRDVYGRVIGLVGRTLLSDVERSSLGIPKYKNTSFAKSKHLFGLYEAKHAVLAADYVYLVEGQFDCISAHSRNINNVVALGSSNMSMDQLIVLLRYTNNIRLLLDNDEAGESGANRILAKFGKYANIEQRRLPSGYKDLDELLTGSEIQSNTELEMVL